MDMAFKIDIGKMGLSDALGETDQTCRTLQDLITSNANDGQLGTLRISVDQEKESWYSQMAAEKLFGMAAANAQMEKELEDIAPSHTLQYFQEYGHGWSQRSDSQHGYLG